MNSIKIVVGLTGLYCSGKSTVEKRLAEKYGFTVIDVDRLGHEALFQKKKELIDAFGNNILTDGDGGSIDRKKLGKIVFSNKQQLKLLNSIVHPWMVEKTRQTVNESSSEKILINAALLYEMGLAQLCSKIVIVTAPWIDIIRRGIKRDKRPLGQILSILMGQKCTRFAKRNRENAEIYSIHNNRDPESLITLTDAVGELLLH